MRAKTSEQGSLGSIYLLGDHGHRWEAISKHEYGPKIWYDLGAEVWWVEIAVLTAFCCDPFEEFRAYPFPYANLGPQSLVDQWPALSKHPTGRCYHELRSETAALRSSSCAFLSWCRTEAGRQRITTVDPSYQSASRTIGLVAASAGLNERQQHPRVDAPRVSMAPGPGGSLEIQAVRACARRARFMMPA